MFSDDCRSIPSSTESCSTSNRLRLAGGSSPSQSSIVTSAARPQDDGFDQQAPYPSSRHSCYLLTSEMLRDDSLRARICEIKGEEAQLMVDYLDAVVRRRVLNASEQRRALALLCKLARSAQIYPRRYELTEVKRGDGIDGGGSADLYKGTHRDQQVCLKAFRVYQKREDNNHMLKIHAHELTLWAHLEHQNILPFYGVYLLDDNPLKHCIVSPFIEGGNLHDFLVKFPKSPRAPLISGILDGLSYLHGLEIVHRDLKPQNVLVSDDGQALITDFGISAIAATTNIMSNKGDGGTTRWMAPEVFSGADEFKPTKSGDIWSLGGTIYELLGGKEPFYQYRDFQLPFVLLRKETPIRLRLGGGGDLKDIDDDLWDLLIQCWSYTPEDRPTCGAVRDFFLKKESLVKWFKIVGKSSNSRDQGEPAAWREKMSDIRIDYECVRGILTRISPLLGRSVSMVGGNLEEPLEQEPTRGWMPFIRTKLFPSRASPKSPDRLKQEEYIIAVMGSTGAGMSTFISIATGLDIKVGHGLEPETSKASAVRISSPGAPDVVLVDTPGFDGKHRSDWDTLKVISGWLQETYEKEVQLSGILYLHRISDHSMIRKPLENLRAFENLRGVDRCRKIMLVTTMWEDVDETVGNKREASLQYNEWADMTEGGSRIVRFDKTRDSAWCILNDLLECTLP